jgi:L-amino acid N-acyltransferase YncA
MAHLIRLARPDDAEALLDIYRPVVRDTIISFETEVPSVESFARRIAHCLDTHPWLACERDDSGIAGYAYATTHRSRGAYQWCVEVSAYVSGGPRRHDVGLVGAAPARRLPVATEAAGRLPR